MKPSPTTSLYTGSSSISPSANDASFKSTFPPVSRMRWVLGSVIVLSFVLILNLLTTIATAASCLYYPQCTEYTYDACGTCERALYATACNGGCDRSNHGICESYVDCTLEDTRTIQADCNPGYVQDEYCSPSACEWVVTRDCYLDPAGDPDGDGVPNSADDCPALYAGSGTCNGCPNEQCYGCLSSGTTCPANGARGCFPDDTQCADFTCQNNCIGNNWCVYSGAATCDTTSQACLCPNPSCSYSTACNLDDDFDGIPDANDNCPNTATGAGVDTYGCSCAQKTCNDNKDCTVDTCSSSTATCIFTPKSPGTSCTITGGGAGQCDAAGTCVQSVTCTAIPGCRTTQPSYSHSVTGTCTQGTCYACDSGYTWNATSGACEAPSCHVCALGQRKCASAGTSYYTCTTNTQGCRVWTTTTTTCGTADCTSYTCTPGATFRGSCAAAPKRGPAPAVG